MVPDLNDCDFTFYLFRNNPLFEQTSNLSINDLVKNCKIENLNKGDCIIDKEKTLYKFYIIASGKLKVFNLNHSDKPFTLFILSKNDVFDIFTLINNQQHNVCYEILEDVELMVVSIDFLRSWLNENPLTLNSLFKYTIKNFELLENHILDLGTNSLTARLANLLLQYYNVNTKKLEGINDLTHDELAQLVGTSRAVFNHNLQKFKKEGIITVGRKRIEVINFSLLVKHALTVNEVI
jgi:CRP/FNR family transcriptional regulator